MKLITEEMKRIFMFMTLVAFAGSCETVTDDRGIKGKEMGVEAGVLEVLNQEGSAYAWQDEDRIGVSVKDMTDYHSETNIAFEYDEETGKFSSVQTDLILKGAERTVYAYFPFKGPELERPEKVEFTTEVQTADSQKEFDWLFAQTQVTREDPVARFEFSHVMGQVRFEFSHKDGVAGQVSGFTVSGISHEGRFDPYTGELIKRTETTADCIPPVNDNASTLVLIPQTAEITVSFVYNNESYRQEVAYPIEVAANECRKYTIEFGADDLDKSLSIVPGGSVDWVTGEVEDITSEPIQVSVYDAGSIGTKALTDNEFKTHFEKDDKVGLFAVKTDGTISDRFDNLALTYNGVEWKAETLLEYDSSLNGAVFHAYFPYSEEVEFQPSADDPFASYLENTYSLDQSSEDKYRDCDLLTCAASLYMEDGKQKLNLGMMHRRSLLSVELPRRVYPVAGLPDYVLSSWDVEFAKADGDVLLPLRVEGEKQVCRMLVQPDAPLDMTCSFSHVGGAKRISIKTDSGIGEGVCRQFRVDGGFVKETKEITLKVGDYFCADGTIVSYAENVAVPDNAVGVIYRLGTTSFISSDHPSCTHALVYALERAKKPDSDTNDYSSLFGDDEYVSVFGLAQDKNYSWSSIGLTTSDHNAMEMNGYGYTASWLLYDGTLGHTAIFKASLEEWRKQNPVPTGITSGWYLSSYDEFVEIARNAGTLNASLAKASAESVFEGTAVGKDNKTYRGYWTSSMRATGAVVNYYSLGDVKQTGYVDGRYGFFRYSFAF